MSEQTNVLPEEQLGPAERLLNLVLNSSAHLWHNRPGINLNGKWQVAKGVKANANQVRPGLFVPAVEALYAQLLDIFQLNPNLMAHFSSYVLHKTEWRDLKVACCALMLVQDRFGEPVREEDGSVAFYDDDYRTIGEAMIMHYVKSSTAMLTPKGVLRVAELLETEEVNTMNRLAGFGDPAGNKRFLGRWKSVARKWLRQRENNSVMLHGLVAAGYKETIKKVARKAGYKPLSEHFFAVLGWKQKQSDGGHRELGLNNLVLAKRDRFDGLSEAEICETIVTQKLKYKEVTGRLPKDIGLTPAIMVAVLPSLSNRDLRQLTPTLEQLGLLTEPEVLTRWELAISEATDQRALNIAKNVSNKEIREKLEFASDNAVRKAVKEATKETEVHVMFLIDKSGSMEGAIEKSKESLTRILAGFPEENVHIAAFDTSGWVLVPKQSSRLAIEHMLKPVKAGGGTIHGEAVKALFRKGVRIPDEARLLVIVVGDEAGESGKLFARAFKDCHYQPHAMALLLNVEWSRGKSVVDCASALEIAFSEITIDQFDDPYQVPRVIGALLETPVLKSTKSFGLVEQIMKTPLLELAV